jgi:GNAT superfamily N-acetyltransferase
VVEIRDSRPGDGEALAAMWLEEGRYYAALDPDAFQAPTEDGLAEWIEEGLARARLRDDVRHLVAELDGQVAGYVLVRIESDADPGRRQIVREVGERRAVIDALGTAETFQQRGVATALVEAAEAWGREQGATRVWTWTYIDSPLSIPFWERRMRYRRREVKLQKPL